PPTNTPVPPGLRLPRGVRPAVPAPRARKMPGAGLQLQVPGGRGGAIQFPPAPAMGRAAFGGAIITTTPTTSQQITLIAGSPSSLPTCYAGAVRIRLALRRSE